MTIKGVINAVTKLTHRSVENPGKPLTYNEALPSFTAGTETTGDPLRVAAGLRAVSVIASAIAGCPLHITDDDGEKVTDQYSWSKPDPKLQGGRTTFEMWETVAAHLVTRGNAYLFKVRDNIYRDKVIALFPINPDRVSIRTEKKNGTDWVKKFVIDGQDYDSTQILHIPGLSVDGVRGISVVENLRRTFELAENSEIIAAKLYSQGLMTNYAIKYKQPIDAEAASIVKARWKASVGGIDRAYEPLILDSEAGLEPLTLKPEDAQFLQTRQFSTTEIARIFGVPGWIINDQEKSTSWGSGMEQQFIAFVMLSLKPYFHRIEERITSELCQEGHQAKFKIEGLLRGDSKSRAAFYASGIQHGWLVPNDVRRLEDMPDVAWGDEPYRPYNEPAGSQPNDDDEPANPKDDDDDNE